MSLQNKRKISSGIKVFLYLFILAAIFLIVGGFYMLIADEELTASIICISVGVVALLFLGLGKFVISRPGNRLGTGLLVGISILLCGGLALAVLVPAAYAVVVQPFADLEHCRQVWQQPVTVLAIVSDHKSYDDEGDTDYRSYISYTYNNVHYENIRFEDKDDKEDLTSQGTLVTIQVSPKDPKKLIQQLKRNSAVVPVSIAILLAGLTAIYTLIQHNRLSRICLGTPDRETVKKDIKIKIRSRFLRPYLLLCGIGYSFLYWRYCVVLNQTPLILAIICGAGWLCCIYATIRDYRHAENDDFELRRDLLVDKQESTDSDGDTTYSLYYKSGEQTWHTNVNATIYSHAKIGQTIVAAYLPSKKKPIIHYDSLGNAR